MTGVIVVGADTASLRFVRYALGQPTIEVLGIVPRQVPADVLAYAFATDSAAAPFRGTVEVESRTLLLAGRHGRGGLRHDRIPIYDDVHDALASGRLTDCLVVGGDDEAGSPDVSGVRMVRLAEVPDPVQDTIAQVVSSVASLGHLRGAFASTTGAPEARVDNRGRLVASRGGRAGSSVSPVSRTGITLELRVGVPGFTDVTVTSLFLQFADPMERALVIRRLRSAARGPLAASIALADGPVGSNDVVGSTASVIDVGAVDVREDAVGLVLFTDTLAVRTRIACELVTGDKLVSSASGDAETSAASDRNPTETM